MSSRLTGLMVLAGLGCGNVRGESPEAAVVGGSPSIPGGRGGYTDVPGGGAGGTGRAGPGGDGGTGAAAGAGGAGGSGPTTCGLGLDSPAAEVPSFAVGGGLPGPACVSPAPEGEWARIESAMQEMDPGTRPFSSFADAFYFERSPPCYARLGIQHGSAYFRFHKGETLRIASRFTTVGPSAHYTDVWEDSTGKVILVSLQSAFGGTPEGDLSQNLALDIAKVASCQTIGSGLAGSVTVSTPGAPGCILSPFSRACCDLWGGTYDVELRGAYLDLGPKPYANVLVLAADRVMPGPEVVSACGSKP